PRAPRVAASRPLEALLDGAPAHHVRAPPPARPVSAASRHAHRITALALLAGALATPASRAAEPARETRPRARDIGIAPGVFPAGPLDAITDVAGVRVGHLTLVEGDRIRTGVTAIVPHAGNVFRDKVAAGVFVGNAFGKLAGAPQVHELG